MNGQMRQPLSEAEIKQFAPGAHADYVEGLVSERAWSTLTRAGINTDARIAEFLGQIAHESGGFTIVREHTTWTGKQMCTLWPSRFKTSLDPRIVACGRDGQKLANLAYAGRADLGNKGGDDGWAYRGGSFLQTTGRDNYRRYGQALGLPLEDHPDLIERADVGLMCAVYEWTKADCNKFADRGYTRAIGNAINRGNPYASHDPIGAASRQQWRDRAVAVFGDGETPKDEGLALGAYGSQVEVLQRRLCELHYGVGATDKVYGPTLLRAVAAFKIDYKRANGGELEPDDIIGPMTWGALNVAKPMSNPARANATVADLKGSTTIKSAMSAKTAATGIAVAAGLQGADQTGAATTVASTVQANLSWLPEMHGFLVPVIDAVKFAEHNLLWVAALGGAVWVYMKNGDVIAARIKDHISGFHLGR